MTSHTLLDSRAFVGMDGLGVSLVIVKQCSQSYSHIFHILIVTG